MSFNSVLYAKVSDTQECEGVSLIPSPKYPIVWDNIPLIGYTISNRGPGYLSCKHPTSNIFFRMADSVFVDCTLAEGVELTTLIVDNNGFLQIYTGQTLMGTFKEDDYLRKVIVPSPEVSEPTITASLMLVRKFNRAKQTAEILCYRGSYLETINLKIEDLRSKWRVADVQLQPEEVNSLLQSWEVVPSPFRSKPSDSPQSYCINENYNVSHPMRPLEIPALTQLLQEDIQYNPTILKRSIHVPQEPPELVRASTPEMPYAFWFVDSKRLAAYWDELPIYGTTQWMRFVDKAIDTLVPSNGERYYREYEGVSNSFMLENLSYDFGMTIGSLNPQPCTVHITPLFDSGSFLLRRTFKLTVPTMGHSLTLDDFKNAISERLVPNEVLSSCQMTSASSAVLQPKAFSELAAQGLESVHLEFKTHVKMLCTSKAMSNMYKLFVQHTHGYIVVVPKLKYWPILGIQHSKTRKRSGAPSAQRYVEIVPANWECMHDTHNVPVTSLQIMQNRKETITMVSVWSRFAELGVTYRI